MKTIVREIRLAASQIVALSGVVGVPHAARFAGHLARSSRAVARHRNLQSVDARMSTHPCYRLRYRGAEMFVPGSYFAGVREMFARDVYLRYGPETLESGSTVVDLGCNQGLFTLYAAKRGASVIAIDAQAGFRAKITPLLEMNDCAERVRFVPAIVGANMGLFSNADILRHAPFYATGTPTLSVTEILTGIPSVTFMKIDIEGSEFALFSEPAEWLDRVDALAMEVHPAFGDPDAIRAFLRSHGWNVRHSPNEDYLYAQRRR